MTSRNSKTSFTSEEMTRIITLVQELEHAESSKQKGIRNKIRKIGLYWSEVAAGMPYTVSNLQRLLENGTLKTNSMNPVEMKKSKLSTTTETIKNISDSLAYSNDEHSATTHRKRDEHYVIDLCDEILGVKAIRQHRFDFLRGDSGSRLPVDAYYPNLNLVIEYHESQHTEATPFFDRKQTVSGVSRGEQRRLYDQRRKELLPQHGIKLIIISYTDFGCSKKLVRDYEHDLSIVRNVLLSAGAKQ